MFAMGDIYGPGFSALRVVDKAVPDPEDQKTMGGTTETVYLAATKPGSLWGALVGLVLLLVMFGMFD